jgi:hypothetical protein
MEESRAAEENLYFENVDATRADRPFNYPDVNPVNAKVSKVPGKSEGLKLALKVMAGDTIEISAKAFYNIDNSFPGANINVAWRIRIKPTHFFRKKAIKNWLQIAKKVCHFGRYPFILGKKRCFFAFFWVGFGLFRTIPTQRVRRR